MKKIKKIMYQVKNNNKLGIKKQEKNLGFTLIELIAVIAIIIILSGVLFPKVLGYVKEAKKLKVVDQCRKVVMAIESYNLRYEQLDKDQTISSIIDKDGIKKYINRDEFSNIDISTTKLQKCYDIVNGAEFNFRDNSEILDNSNILDK